MSWSQFWLRKVAHLIAVLFLVTIGVAALLSAGGSAAYQILGPNATPEQITELEHQLGLDQPFLQRYFDWLGDVLHGDFGQSLLTGAPVTDIIVDGLTVTAELVILGLLVALVVSVPLAAYAARHAGGKVDVAATAVASLFMSLPSFVLAIALLYVFAVQLAWLPVGGWTPISEGLGENLRSVTLPALVLALHPMATFFRVLRADMITTLQQDFVLTARSKGLDTRYILLRHALRPSLTSLLTMAGLSIGTLITGAVISEVIFRLPGVGSAMVDAVNEKDVPIVQGLVLVVALTYVVVNAAVDLIQTVVDPRVQAS